MRIVASRATDPLVVAKKTLAVCQTVRLKSDIRLAELAQPDDEFPSAVALAAERRHLLGRQFSQPLWSDSPPALGQGFQVSVGAGVAVFAGNAGLHGIEC